MTVLVLAVDHDPTVDRIVCELSRREVPVFRADLGWFPQLLSLTAQLGTTGDTEAGAAGGAGACAGWGGVAGGARKSGRWRGRLRSEYREVDLGDVRSVLYRRPTSFTFPAGLSGPERRHANWEAKLGVGGILADLPALWVNHPAVIADAAYKPLQLSTALRCGFTVPPTLITNDPGQVRAFAADHGPIVVKTLAFGAIVEDGGTTVLHTHLLQPRELDDLAGVATTTHLFQTFIADKAFEARVTAVGDRLFAAAIHAGSDAARIDWRSDYSALSYSVLEVPDSIAGRITRYMAVTGLTYAAFDFVVDLDHRWWWLEANSGGQYGWIEAATGLPITHALAELLEKGPS